MNSSTIPVMGSVTADRSASIGVATWVIAMRKTTTRTSLETINATTKAAHLPIQERVTSHAAPANATGARTIATNSSALRIRRLNQTMATAQIMSPARKIVTIAPTPGALMLIAVRPAVSRAILSPMVPVVSPAAWTMPMESWSTISRAVAVRVMTRKEPSTALPAPSAALERAEGSRRMRPRMSWKQKKSRTMNTPMPNSRLYTSR
ncbi:hypothetical protein SDC9_172955 [bioreactor metagenome]|uniref:Uncharacterized protein n=1 Tax=bioreactor metagenome TaxID=1076179 RepID=A0A645GPC1_9ZZZZ